jgi:hypothetical protein
MTNEEITKLVMDLSRSWKHRLVFDTKPFEDDMIAMCKKVRQASAGKEGCNHVYKCKKCDTWHCYGCCEEDENDRT